MYEIRMISLPTRLCGYMIMITENAIQNLAKTIVPVYKPMIPLPETDLKGMAAM